MNEEQLLNEMQTETYAERIQGKLRYNLFAEMGILSSVLVKLPLMSEISNKLNSEDFFLEEHANIFSFIFSFMRTLYEEFGKLDPVLVIEKTRGKERNKKTEEVLMRLIDNTPNTANFDLYVKVVKECSLLRKIFDKGNRIVSMSSSGDNPRRILDSAERMLVQLAFSNEYKVIAVGDACIE